MPFGNKSPHEIKFDELGEMHWRNTDMIFTGYYIHTTVHIDRNVKPETRIVLGKNKVLASLRGLSKGIIRLSIGIDDNSVDNQSQNVTNWYRFSGGGYSQVNYGDAWYWYDNPTTGSSWTTLMSLNASGNLAINGSLSKGSGSFDIPHPVLEDKRLRHSFIEGPYADLIYRGTVTLGAEPVTICMDEQYGMAEGTWKALNTNPWSIVSASGKLVEWSLDECKLTITGDEGTVCQWMVIGERKDQHMIDTDSTNNDGRLILEYTPTAEPEDIHDQPPTPDYR